MNVQEVIESFSSSPLQVDRDMIAEFWDRMKVERYGKNHILHKPDRICHKLYFVEKGIVRTYYNHDGRDVTVYFTFRGELVTAIDSFVQRQPSKYYLELLEDSEFRSFTHQDLEELYLKYPGFERFGRVLMEQAYIDLVDRTESIQLLNASERYQKLIDAHPTLPSRVNLGYIASFLGVSQETLSRVRNQS